MRFPRPTFKRRRATSEHNGSTRAWSDRIVVMCLAIGVAGIAFAAGRFSVDPGPQSVQEAMQLAQAGELPFSPDGSTAGPMGGGFQPGGPGGRAGRAPQPDAVGG